MKSCLVLLALPSVCFAAKSIPPSYETRLAAVEKALDHGYNLPASISSGIFLQGDVLYWTARELGLEYALKVNSAETHYAVEGLQFDWDFGFRAGIGTTTKGRRLDLGLYWTHLFTRAKDRGSISSSEGFIPIWSHPNFVLSSETATDADADWKLNYNELDLNFQYAFYVGKSFILRPFLGPSLLWLNQGYKLKYGRAEPVSGDDHVKMKNKFTGVGLTAGSDLQFCFKHGWSLYGKAGVGLYYGKFHIKRKEHFIDELDDFESLHAKQLLHVGTPTTTLGIGIRWDHGFSHNRYSLSLKLLWEQLLFFGQNQLFRFLTPSNNDVQSNYAANQGDLTLQGGTFSVHFTF